MSTHREMEAWSNSALYQLIRQRGPISERVLEIEFPEAGAEAYCFIFG
jgi:hypothetical protein